MGDSPKLSFGAASNIGFLERRPASSGDSPKLSFGDARNFDFGEARPASSGDSPTLNFGDASKRGLRVKMPQNRRPFLQVRSSQVMVRPSTWLTTFRSFKLFWEPFLPIFACRGGPGSAAPRGGGPRGTQKLIIFWFFCSPEPFTKIFWKRKPRENLAKTLRKPPENLPKTSRKPRENLANTLGILWYQCSYGTLLFNLMLELLLELPLVLLLLLLLYVFIT